MRILVISDSHSLEKNQKIIDLENCDFNVHCGDSQLMSNDPDMKSFDMTCRGNCDFDRNYQISEVKDLNGLKLMVTHGHYFDVNYSLSSLRLAAIEKDVDVAFYGHTHVVNVDYQNNVLIINPGSLRQSRSAYPTTYVVLEMLADKFIVNIKDASSYQLIEQKIINK